MGFFDFFEEWFIWTISCFRYNFRREEYQNKVIDKSRVVIYLIFGIFQIIYILIWAIFMALMYYFQYPYNFEQIAIGISTPMIIFAVFLIIKSIWFAYSVRKILIHMDQTYKKKTIIFLWLAYIPLIGYFTTLIFYKKAEKLLKDNGYSFENTGF
ncbi:hypothetical protein [Spiroplasma endosymbiont of Diplazon laetatorius]|uniref:hypothetical protein n=1 Tax=Spiroplasma endosymbiont of Diplazon laetatorius TaxID=3066322 RepID=UPI0030D477A6